MNSFKQFIPPLKHPYYFWSNIVKNRPLLIILTEEIDYAVVYHI